MKHPARISVLTLLVILITACASSAPTTNTATASKPKYYIYLAGPEVFLPDPIAAGVAKKQIITDLNTKHQWPFTLHGLYPMDNEFENFAPDKATGLKIYHANIALMEKAHFVTANMVRFRGPSMDVGTAFEMGYMRGLNKPVFAYYDAEPFYGKPEAPGIYSDRVGKFYPLAKGKSGVDIDGQSIENFNMEDNLMMIGALDSKTNEIAPSFENAVLEIANLLLERKQ